MNLRSREEAFRFVMSEVWSEVCHINQSLKPCIFIECGDTAFMLHLEWYPFGATFRERHSSKKMSLSQLCDKNFSMTSWLRTFIAESGVHGDNRDRKK